MIEDPEKWAVGLSGIVAFLWFIGQGPFGIWFYYYLLPPKGDDDE